MLGNTKNKPYSFRTILPWLLIVLGLFLLVIALYAASTKPPKLAGRADVIKLQAIVSDIKAKLGDASGAWQDTSSCTIVEPRKFGQETRYHCEVQYERTRKVSSQKEIERVIDEDVQKLSRSEYVKSLASASYPVFGSQEGIESVGGAEISLGHAFSSHHMCALEYRLVGNIDDQRMRQRIRCYIDTDGTYLQKVDRI